MKKNFLVSIDRTAEMSEVARHLTGAGLSIDEKDDVFCLVTGSADANKLASLRKIPGVRHIEESRSYEAPERDAAVQ